jgi:hypothetical protein
MRASNVSSLPIESGKVVGLDCSQGDGAARTMEDREYRKRIGFVRQQDFLVEHLTGEQQCILKSLSLLTSLVYSAGDAIFRKHSTPIFAQRINN